MKTLELTLEKLHEAIEQTREALLEEALGAPKVCACCQYKHYGIPLNARVGEMNGTVYAMWECGCNNTISKFLTEREAA